MVSEEKFSWKLLMEYHKDKIWKGDCLWDCLWRYVIIEGRLLLKLIVKMRKKGNCDKTTIFKFPSNQTNSLEFSFSYSLYHPESCIPNISMSRNTQRKYFSLTLTDLVANMICHLEHSLLQH